MKTNCMKNVFSLFLLASAFACTQEKVVEITISNPSSIDRTNEITEITQDAVVKFEGQSFILTDSKGMQVPYQVTHDQKIIFPVTVKAGENVTYKITAGTPDTFPTITCGKQYPERVDDIAWENDRIAFRTYGPALQATGEKAYGCDIWVKCVSEPVVQLRYDTELNPETKAKIAELRKTDPKAAQQLAEATTYHIDHGNGLDYYKVGPTLGAGTSALLANDSIVYPYCYKDFQVLDNGPLRFTVKLVYNPLTVKDNNNVVETRVISLDAGSQMNKVSIAYANLTEATPLVTGIVMHAPSEDFQADAAKGYIAYADPADPTNGQTFIAAVFPGKLNDAEAVKFSDAEDSVLSYKHVIKINAVITDISPVELHDIPMDGRIIAVVAVIVSLPGCEMNRTVNLLIKQSVVHSAGDPRIDPHGELAYVACTLISIEDIIDELVIITVSLNYLSVSECETYIGELMTAVCAFSVVCDCTVH